MPLHNSWKAAGAGLAFGLFVPTNRRQRTGEFAAPHFGHPRSTPEKRPATTGLADVSRHQHRYESNYEGSAVHGLLFDRDRRRNDRLAVRVRLGHRGGCKMAVGLIQVPDELNDLFRRASNHNPKRKVYFQRDCHRYRLFLIFEDSKQLTPRMEQKFQPKSQQRGCRSSRIRPAEEMAPRETGCSPGGTPGRPPLKRAGLKLRQDGA